MKKSKLIVLMSILIMLQLTGCGRTYRSGTKKDCTSIQLQDIEFQMPNMLLQDAEDIEALNDNISFSKTYIYSMNDEYCCINMDSFVVYLFLGTSDASSMYDYLELFYEKGLRLEMNEDNIALGEDACENPKTIIDKVYCEAVFTNELYEDYTGKVVLIRETGRNICLYVGAKGRYIELDKDVEKVLDDIAYTLTSTKEETSKENNIPQEATEITQGKSSTVSILNEHGEIEEIELQDISVLDNASVYENELKAAPEGYKWEFIRISGTEEIKQIKIKVKDLSATAFAYGSRTYTVFCANGERIDAYLIPDNVTEYLLQFGEIGKQSNLKIS